MNLTYFLNLFHIDVWSICHLSFSGAWIGPTVLFAGNFAKKVLAIEPDKSAFETLRRNTDLNPQLHITSIHRCISSVDETVFMNPGGIMAGDSASQVSRIKTDRTTPAVHCSPITSVVAEFNLSPPFFIKIDTEGFEAEIVPSWASWIPLSRPTIFLSMHR